MISIRDLKIHCATCSMRELCLPGGLTADELGQVDAMVGKRTKLKKGDALYRAGEPFAALYAIRLGSLKTTVLAEDGREQVSGYHMLGDIVGLDGIGTDRHGCQAVALEDTEVCVLPFERIEELARDVPALQHNLHQFLSREIARDHGVMLMLGSMRAEERLAVVPARAGRALPAARLLIDRVRAAHDARGNRQLPRTQAGDGQPAVLPVPGRRLIQVQGRDVKLLDPIALKQLVSQRGP